MMAIEWTQLSGGCPRARSSQWPFSNVSVHWDEILHIIKELLKQYVGPYDILNEKDVFEGDSF